MQEQIERDLKAALLAGDKIKVETLKGVKSAILNETISLNARESGLTDEQIQKVLSRESKKRAEAVELYQKAGEESRAEAELNEKSIIDAYLPAPVSEDEIAQVVETEITKLNSPSMSDMGQIIGAVRSQLGAQADGGVIARLVKASLEDK